MPMGPVFAEAEIDASRQKIFDYLLDLGSRPVIFGDSVTEFRLLDIQSRGIGSGARFRFGKRGSWVDLTITGAEEPRRISERGHTGRGNRTPAGMEWEIEETPAGPSRVRASYWTEVSGVAGAVDRITGGAGKHERMLRSALTRLRSEVESGVETSEVPRIAGIGRFETGVP